MSVTAKTPIPDLPTPNFLERPARGIWTPNKPIPDFLERTKNVCKIQNIDSRFSGTSADCLLANQFQIFWNVYKTCV
jgi:hypothetical protein